MDSLYRQVASVFGIALWAGLSGCGSSNTPDAANSDSGAMMDAAALVDSSLGTPDSLSADTSPQQADTSTVTDASSVDIGMARADASTLDASGSGSDSGSSAADGGSANDSGSAEGSCDPRRVTCRLVPPECTGQEVPSVIDTCWGPCVPARSCTCATTDDCPMVSGVSEVCYTDGRCGALLN